MTTFLCIIGPTVENDLHVDLDRFAQALAARWPDARLAIPRPPDPDRALAWTITTDTGRLEGHINQAGQVSYLRGRPQLIADYALWLRHSQPEAPLQLLHDKGCFILPLLPTTTAEEIINFIPRN